MSTSAVIKSKGSPPIGYHAITRIGERHFDTGIEFGLLNLAAHQVYEDVSSLESVWLLLTGKIEGSFDSGIWSAERSSLFDEGPSCLHLPANKKIKIKTGSVPVEIAVAKTKNENMFEPQIYSNANLTTEYRGEGLVQGTCLREVRQIFDKHSRPQSNLVLGEVVNYPGRWSSYPPHHHAQPEIYHYRFTEPQGYGHAELGDAVYKVQNHDTVKILDGIDHGQVSAPGYGMYYFWVIRHLPGDPYLGFEFTEEHKWILNPKNQGWIPNPRAQRQEKRN